MDVRGDSPNGRSSRFIQEAVNTEIVTHLTGASTPLEDKNPYSSGSAAVRASKAAGPGFVSIDATTTSLITVLTCFTDGKGSGAGSNACDQTANQLTNTVSID